MSDKNKIDSSSDTEQINVGEENNTPSSEVSSVLGSVKTTKTSQQLSSERLIKLERAQKCLENVALVSKRIMEQRKATAELLGRPFDDDDVDTASEMASTMSEKTGYSVATDVSTALSVQDALNIPGISESLANTLKQKELLLERIKHYKEISKKPPKSTTYIKRDVLSDTKKEIKKHTDSSGISQLLATIKEKENALSVTLVKMKALEDTVLDLKEKINEKDQIIEAKNMATTLMSDTLSKKEKDSLMLLEDTKQQMIKMQENFVAMEAEWKQEKQVMLKELEHKDEKINSLEEANSILEASRFEISIEHAKLSEQIDSKNREIRRLEESIHNLSHGSSETAKEKEDKEEEKGSLEVSAMVELTKKIELLEQINCQIRQTNKELENKLASANVESKVNFNVLPIKKGSPVPTRKGGRATASKMKSPWSKLSSETLTQETDKKSNKSDMAKLEMLVQSLNKEVLEKEYIISQKNALILELESTDKQIRERDMIEVGISTHEEMSVEKSGEMDPKSVGISVENIKDVITFQSKNKEPLDVSNLNDNLQTAQEQIVFLNNEIEIANKNMIKVKSSHKLKIKQMQKTIDNLSKISDANAEIVKLNEEMHHLSQKVAELEEEKGNLQLHLVDYDSGRLTESDIYKKMIEMENLAETRLRAISVLETQKFDLVQELHILQQKNNEMEDKIADISQLHSEQVCSEIKLVQLEEQLDQLIASKRESELVTENLKLDKEQLNGTIKLLEEKNLELIHKLESYIQVNTELSYKLDKLSAEKVSSAESIEIVESLTTQEKLELEEYNKIVLENKDNNHDGENMQSPDIKLDTLIEQSSDLTKKIELFTQEREEVMDKMTKISEENEMLHQKVKELKVICDDLHKNVELLNNEKLKLQNLNVELNRQLEETKLERIEIIKETTEIVKTTHLEDALEYVPLESQHDEKQTGDKGVSRTKSVKQLTKEILKLKNIVKDRENEIADCQMKILSLEEHQQKQNDILQNTLSLDNKIKILAEENSHLKDIIENLKSDKESEQQLLQYKHAHVMLQQEIQKTHQDYSVTVSTRDARINELENVLVEYEKQLFNYGNTLQEKDKEINELVNQITQLNDISQKLKLTVELLEEEKTKDQNGELIKSLNKQATILQKKLIEYEDKIRILEDEKSQLLALQTALENKNVNIDADLKKLQEVYSEKQVLLKDLQAQHLKHSEEKSTLILQTKERDEEIHEIKLQLRKESIENEKLRNGFTAKEHSFNDLAKSFEDVNQKTVEISQENEVLRQEIKALELKNKETIEKLKKFALNLKKKSLMYTDLENTLLEIQRQQQVKNEQTEQLLIQVETLPVLQDKLKHAEEEINRLQTQKVSLDQNKSQEIGQLQNKMLTLEAQVKKYADEITSLNETVIEMQKELNFTLEENIHLKTLIDNLNKKLAEFDIDQKNIINFETKINSLEDELNLKENQLSELVNRFEFQEQLRTQAQFGYDAKIQERDLYIDSLEYEMAKYKNRICRLEETISVMEDMRHSLERKADQLGSHLQEKQKAYTEYTDQEDELVGRLAVLMDHDRVVEKQLLEIENDNKDLQKKVQVLTEDNQRIKKSLSDIQQYCNTLVEKADKFDKAEAEITNYQSKIHDLEVHLKRTTSDSQTNILQKKKEIEELEIEFNSQIEVSIKEKKLLSEKYEKTIERVTELERKVQEYSNNIVTLNKNLEEVNNINQNLIEKSTNQRDVQDYTEHYISEINKLTCMINNKNQEISELTIKVQTMQLNNIALIADLESKVSWLSTQLTEITSKNNQLLERESYLKQNNEQLQLLINQKDEHIKDLVGTKKMTFEMNIPKTEGLLISSTIEPLSKDQKPLDISSLESQIITNVASLEEVPTEEKESIRKISEQLQSKSLQNVDFEINTERTIVPKKAYMCYNYDDSNQSQEPDPFNSDEGWGLGDNDDLDDSQGFTHLNEIIQKLKKDNDSLKSDLEINNSKLIKALKKLKELKNVNEMLSNEIKISKQLSSSFLDTAIEDELRLNIQGLEKKIEELGADINKEKREKDTIKKQNEIFNSANDRLTEIKEKLENEIELWKYKFKEANDKLLTMQWGVDSTESPRHGGNPENILTEEKLKEDINKIEKENDELQSTVDQLSKQNEGLVMQQEQLKIVIKELKEQIQQQACVATDGFQNKCNELQHLNDDLLKQTEILNIKIHDIEESLNEAYENSKTQTDMYEASFKNLEVELEDTKRKYNIIEEEMKQLKLSEVEANNTVAQLTSQLEQDKLLILQYEQKLKINSVEVDNIVTLQVNEMENKCKQLKQNLDDANAKIHELELKNTQFEDSTKNYVTKINEMSKKIQDLNDENDNLLSTVAELRSSVSTAIDQRGFEIAELWKQHLAQRESDFQELEHELRSQLTASESKYEQLLDSVQSSSQEETSKLIMAEQVSSLQSKILDKEEHLCNLQGKYTEVMNQLDILRSEIEDEKVTYENKLLEQQEDYEKIIHELRNKNIQNLEDNQVYIKTLESELDVSKVHAEELVGQNEKLQNKIAEMNSKMLDLTNELRVKDSEIYQTTHEYNISLTQRNEEFENVRKHLVDYEKKVEDLTYEKESELAVLRLKMHENMNHQTKLEHDSEIERTNLTLALDAKIRECTSLNKQIADLNKLLEEYSSKTEEMQFALENQEIEIVSLKDEIVGLQNMLKLTNSKIQKHVSFASDSKPGDDENYSMTMSKELLDAVPRAELDLALYMLHQRDVRCEELTMELTQLLEERDTLQLRLSDSLRSQEELKSKCQSAELDDSVSSNRDTITGTASFSIEREQPFVNVHRGHTSRSSSMSDPDGDKPKLQAKLTELRSVKHSRDVRLRHESEQRQMDLRLLQRDVANLPPEAIDQLNQAHHTLSRDAQSTPTVLLNWLRGKSTPKVVHM